MSKNLDFNLIKSKSHGTFSDYSEHTEANEYLGCTYKYLDKKYIQRTSKITPKKIGQFVTLWKRNSKGETCPFDSEDIIDYVVIICHSDITSCLFKFPKEVLLQKNILTNTVDSREGKRGFRIYPPWDKPTSKQALKTQKWQLEFFKTDLSLD